jgi:RimJ/RimL family protein N-acetyltransferase
MREYKVLSQRVFSNGDYKIVPIRHEDRFKIMEWRNEQIYHLRQKVPLTVDNQEVYFNNIITSLFIQERPSQILFSFLKGNQCIGYGGLVHINWAECNAEISFILETRREKEYFDKEFYIFLNLINVVAFDDLNLHKIFTYAFDVRPQLYTVLESAGFRKEAVLKDHCIFEGVYKDIVIHAKYNLKISI